MAVSLISSSSSSNTPQLKYDVFISFRGEDTRCKFTSHLDKALRDKHIKTFIDYELNRGDEISASLLEAIEKSQISVIVFSGDYASSKWCLDELVKILECREKNEQMVIPVFYEVDPSDVRHQTGSFTKAFAEHEQLFKENKVQRWKDALKETANLAGWDSSTFRLESEFIETIVQDVLEKTNRLSSPDTSHLVGIDSKIKEIESLLSIGTNDVRSVGIWGIGGIGKTTLAETVFNKISHQFEGSCFCRNVRERCKQSNGLHHLQQELLKALLVDKNENIGTCVIGRRLGRMKLLIVFDDVSNFKEIECLIGGLDRLGPQSLIIMTTRDLQVLRNGGVDQVYEVRQLIDHEALELFSRHAFRKNHSTEDYMELSKRVAKYARGIPLALTVLGSHLLGRRKEVWVSAIDKLETIPHKDIQKVLKISYDGLDDEEKNIFLDIAHFFKRSSIGPVKEFIEALGFRADIGIDVLIDKSLITMSDNIITMHDLLQAMAREIVRQESIDDPGKRSRLWHHKDIYHILTKNSGTKTIQGISLDMSKIGDIHLNPRAFANMHELRFLNFYNSSLGEANKVHVSEALAFDFTELRYLGWYGCPIKSLLSSSLPENLVILDMSYMKVQQLWNGVLDDKAAVEDAFIRAIIRYPGSDIPKWFKFRSNGSFINVELPPDWFNYNYARFVLTIVVAPCLDHQDGVVENWCIEWNCNLKSKDGDPCVRTGSFHIDTIGKLDIRSNHVFCGLMCLAPSEFLGYDNEINFQFYIRGMKQHCKVEKCGVHLMFAQHREQVNGSSRIGEDEDVLSLTNTHDNCEEEDELIKVSGSRKRKRDRKRVIHRRCRRSLPR